MGLSSFAATQRNLE